MENHDWNVEEETRKTFLLKFLGVIEEADIVFIKVIFPLAPLKYVQYWKTRGLHMPGLTFKFSL